MRQEAKAIATYVNQYLNLSPLEMKGQSEDQRLILCFLEKVLDRKVEANEVEELLRETCMVLSDEFGSDAQTSPTTLKQAITIFQQKMEQEGVHQLFSPKPQQWGLRGDPYLWDDMKEALVGKRADNEASLETLVAKTFEELTAGAFYGDKDVCVEQFAHGGMSSGFVSPSFWREHLLPLLKSRLNALSETV